MVRKGVVRSHLRKGSACSDCHGHPAQGWPGGKATTWLLYIAGVYESVERAVSGRMNQDVVGSFTLSTLEQESNNKFGRLSFVPRSSEAGAEDRCTSNVASRKFWDKFLGRRETTQIFGSALSTWITAPQSSPGYSLGPHVPSTGSVI